MRVFISWSTERSKKLAAAIKQLIRHTTTAADPWFSEEDVLSGRLAIADIFRELEEARHGFLCLTNETRERSWPMFDAGALAREVGRANVVPVTLDYEPSLVPGPLKEFQGHHARDKDKWLKSLRELNQKTSRPLDDDVLARLFDPAWAAFVEALDAIPDTTTEAPPKPSLDEKVDELVSAFERMERVLDESSRSAVAKPKRKAPNAVRVDERGVVRVAVKGPAQARSDTVSVIVTPLDDDTSRLQAVWDDREYATTIPANHFIHGFDPTVPEAFEHDGVPF